MKLLKKLFICNGVHIDIFLNTYINLKDEQGNYINEKMKEFIDEKNEKTKKYDRATKKRDYKENIY